MSDRITFLNSSLTDMQATIRAIDVKVAALLVALLTPLPNLHRVFKHLIHFNNHSPIVLGYTVGFLFLLFWFLSFFALARSVSAIDNPSRHIMNGSGLSGAYFLGGLYPFKFLDSFLNRSIIMANRDPVTVAAALPATIVEIEAELVFEQMKLAYIRDIKMNRLFWGLVLALLWLLLGIAIYLYNKFGM